MTDQGDWAQPVPEPYPGTGPQPVPEPYPGTGPQPMFPPAGTGPQPMFPPAGQFPPGSYPPPPGYWPPGMPPPVPRRSRRWWWIGGATALVVALVIGGIFWIKGRNDGGADSPRAAVLQFLAAAENNDAFAAAKLLDPAERSGVTRVLDNAHDTAEKSSYQHGGGRNGLLQGVHIAADNVQTTVDDIRSDLARVTFTGGQITLGFDPAQANAGLRDLFRDKDSTERTWTARDLTSRSSSGERLQAAVMTVKRSGRWYISVLYSYLDGAARAEDRPPVDPGPIDTESYSSPEAAAQGFLDGVVATVTSARIMPVAKTLSPEAGALLATYRPLLEHGMEPHTIEVLGTPKFSAKTSGSTATVTIEDMTLQDTDDDGHTSKVRFHGDCITTERRTECGTAAGNPNDSLLLAPRTSGFTATRGGTGWHIDPVATYLDAMANAVRDASKEEVALLLAETFGAPKAFLRLTAQESLNPGGSTTVTLVKSGGQGLGFAVLDLPVSSGDRVRITGTAASDYDDSGYHEVWWMAVGEAGELASGDTYLYGDEYSTGSFTATDSETARVVLWGPADASVTVKVS